MFFDDCPVVGEADGYVDGSGECGYLRLFNASAVIGTSPRVPGSTFGLTRLEANLPVGIPGKYDVESTR